MIDWLWRYEVRAHPSGPAWAPGYRHKIVLHTTETGWGSSETLIRKWQDAPGSGRPHFLVDGDRVVQLLPLTAGAYTLENPPGGVETNRGGAIQVEVTGFARDAAFWTDGQLRPLAELIADIASVFPIDLVHVEPTGRAGEVPRMAPDRWKGFAGVTTHARAPEQPSGHWDPGPLNMARLLQLARGPEDEELDMGAVEVILERLDHLEATLGTWEKQTRNYEGLRVYDEGDGTLTAIVIVDGQPARLVWTHPVQITALRKLDVVSEYGGDPLTADELAYLNSLPTVEDLRS